MIFMAGRVEGMVPPVCRMGVLQVDNETDIAAYSEAAVAAGRLYDYRSACTVSLLAIVFQLAFESPARGGCRSEVAQAGCKMLADALLVRAGVPRVVLAPGDDVVFHERGVAMGTSCIEVDTQAKFIRRGSVRHPVLTREPLQNDRKLIAMVPAMCWSFFARQESRR